MCIHGLSIIINYHRSRISAHPPLSPLDCSVSIFGGRYAFYYIAPQILSRRFGGNLLKIGVFLNDNNFFFFPFITAIVIVLCSFDTIPVFYTLEVTVYHDETIQNFILYLCIIFIIRQPSISIAFYHSCPIRDRWRDNERFYWTL